MSKHIRRRATLSAAAVLAAFAGALSLTATQSAASTPSIDAAPSSGLEVTPGIEVGSIPAGTAQPDSAFEGCTTNTSGYTAGDLRLSGVMAGCPRGTLEIDAKLYLDGSLTATENPPHTCTNSTECSLPALNVYECFAAGEYYVTVRGHHGNAVDEPTVYFTVDSAIAQACSAAHPAYPVVG